MYLLGEFADLWPVLIHNHSLILISFGIRGCISLWYFARKSLLMDFWCARNFAIGTDTIVF